MRLLLVEDHAVVGEALSLFLNDQPDIEVVGTARTGRAAVRLCLEKTPDVVVMDFGLPDMDGFELARQLLELKNGARILVLTMHQSEEYARRLLVIGVGGYIVKSAPSTELLTAIRKVARNRRYVSPDIMDQMLDHIGQVRDEAPEENLSDRELQVLTRLARGLTSREVANVLCLSVSTIETYRARLKRKLGVQNVADMTRFAIRRGLIDS